MKQAHLASLAGLSCLAVATIPASARAMMVAPAPLAQRVATADCVVIGKVTRIEDKTVTAARFPGDKEKGEYQVAVVQIEEAVVGARGLTHIRVGFIPPTPVPVPDAGPGPKLFIKRRPQVTLTQDQEVCL